MIHDSGPATGRALRMRRRFPDADLVVFGHSHIPLDVTGAGVRILNPGSPTDRRRQPYGTLGVLTIEDGAFAPPRSRPCRADRPVAGPGDLAGAGRPEPSQPRVTAPRARA